MAGVFGVPVAFTGDGWQIFAGSIPKDNVRRWFFYTRVFEEIFAKIIFHLCFSRARALVTIYILNRNTDGRATIARPFVGQAPKRVLSTTRV